MRLVNDGGRELEFPHERLRRAWTVQKVRQSDRSHMINAAAKCMFQLEKGPVCISGCTIEHSDTKACAVSTTSYDIATLLFGSILRLSVFSIFLRLRPIQMLIIKRIIPGIQ